jgi:hypothetical protein
LTIPNLHEVAINLLKFLIQFRVKSLIFLRDATWIERLTQGLLERSLRDENKDEKENI